MRQGALAAGELLLQQLCMRHSLPRDLHTESFSIKGKDGFVSCAVQELAREVATCDRPHFDVARTLKKAAQAVPGVQLPHHATASNYSVMHQQLAAISHVCCLEQQLNSCAHHDQNHGGEAAQTTRPHTYRAERGRHLLSATAAFDWLCHLGQSYSSPKPSMDCCCRCPHGGERQPARHFHKDVVCARLPVPWLSLFRPRLLVSLIRADCCLRCDLKLRVAHMRVYYAFPTAALPSTKMVLGFRRCTRKNQNRCVLTVCLNIASSLATTRSSNLQVGQWDHLSLSQEVYLTGVETQHIEGSLQQTGLHVQLQWELRLCAAKPQ
eukprot:4406181-Amphidinium_carterae.1